MLRDAKGHFAAAGLEGPLRDVSRSLRSGFRCLKRDPQVAEGIKGMVVAWLEKHKEQLGDPLHFLHPDTNGQHTKAPLLKLVLGMADKYLRPKLAEVMLVLDSSCKSCMVTPANISAPSLLHRQFRFCDCRTTVLSSENGSDLAMTGSYRQCDCPSCARLAHTGQDTGTLCHAHGCRRTRRLSSC